ncbi:MAG: alkaline phosphatase family protein [bacterium]|nr:alkaline phosphatase family protein [bacterium]
MKSRAISATLAVVLMVVAVSLGVVSARRVQRQAMVGEICDATRNSEWELALSLGDDAVDSGEEGRIAAECLCWAYAAQDRLDECVQLVEKVLADPAADDWVPDVTIARMVVRQRAESGLFQEAAELARRANKVYSRDTQLIEAEMINRSIYEDEIDVLADMRTRLSDDLETSLALRLVLSAGYERRSDWDGSLEVLGEVPPPEPGSAQTAWFEGRAGAFAGSERREELKKTYDWWQSMGGNSADMAARYAIRVSMFGLSDPDFTRIELLKNAMDDEEKLGSDALKRTLYERLIGHYLVDGYTAEALEVYDRAKEKLDNVLISREEILRSAASSSRLSDLGADRAPNALVFHTPEDAPPGRLLISPAIDEEPDTEFHSLPIRPGRSLRVERKSAIHPQRWVYRGETGQTLASGTVWPDRRETRVDIQPRPPKAPEEFEPQLAQGDGRRRVFVVIPDCEDWRIVQYLRARGEMPVHDFILRNGYRAVLESSPAFTGAAMESLVWPTRGKHVTFLGLANRLGMEIGGLASVGKNPFAFLQKVLPEGENLFERVGAGPHVTANLLFSHGYIDAGEHAELIGPSSKRRPAGQLLAMRPLNNREKNGLPEIFKHHRAYRSEVEKMAAEFDSATNLARSGEVDLLLIRIEPLDILTHTFFTEMLRSEQDDGAHTLLWAYRYLDRRIGEVWQELDADDVLVVMSDHGIRTALEHDEAAIFTAIGGGIEHGRAPGQPHLRGIPQTLAALLGVQTSWPKTIVADWPEAPTRAHAQIDSVQVPPASPSGN